MLGIARRTFLVATIASTLLSGVARAAGRIPQRPSARVIVDNDFAGDPDGLVALAHQLLSPKTTVPLVTVSALNPEFMELAGSGNHSIAPGIEIAKELITRLGIATPPLVLGGREISDKSDGGSPAAKAIVREAMRDDPLPLYFTCGGPLSNLAEALKLEPAIAGRMTVIWIGGGPYPHGGDEYNLGADLEAARWVLGQTQVPIWQVPQPTYRLMLVSVAEMESDLRPIAPFTEWLYQRFTNPPDFVDLGGSWPMGDSPLVLLTAISAESSRYTEHPAREIRDDLTYGGDIPGRSIRVFDYVDMRLTWADFLAKLRLHSDHLPLDGEQNNIE